eukprot:5595274-Prorocentrum_lima.AAC.1
MLDQVFSDDIDDSAKKVEGTIPLAVARSCSLKEAEKNPKAKAALDKAWERLRAINTWDESIVRERDE